MSVIAFKEAKRPFNQDFVDHFSGQQWSEGEAPGAEFSSSLIAHSGQAMKPVDYNRSNSNSCVLLWSEAVRFLISFESIH